MTMGENGVMTVLPLLLAALALVAAGCGEEERQAVTPAPAVTATAGAPMKERASKPTRRGTRIVLDGSEFGDMLYDADQQAIYVFERDGRDKTRCFDECLEAWPAVLTKGAPVAGPGVDRKLLGTIEREDGGTQVTYAGRPLYYYAHEAPGEVRCHNIDLNGGLWWVVGADGEPLP
jgi:predicted lipoprotein with Yx(FWY)xxD motif